MWTTDDEDEQEPTDKERIAAFFEKYGYETIIEKDIGYGCSTMINVNELYDIFKLRLKLEEQV